MKKGGGRETIYCCRNSDFDALLTKPGVQTVLYSIGRPWFEPCNQLLGAWPGLFTNTSHVTNERRSQLH